MVLACAKIMRASGPNKQLLFWCALLKPRYEAVFFDGVLPKRGEVFLISRGFSRVGFLFWPSRVSMNTGFDFAPAGSRKISRLVDGAFFILRGAGFVAGF